MNKVKIGLALSSGGARGAYEVGAMIYMAEKGLRFDAVSGSSIGALNGAFYVQGDGSYEHMHSLRDCWLQLASKNIVQVDGKKFAKLINLILLPQTPIEKSLILLNEAKAGLLDIEPIVEVLDNWLNYSAIRKSNKELVIGILKDTHPLLSIIAYPFQKATYITASDFQTDNYLRDYLIASFSIPVIYPTQKIDGSEIIDSGLTDPLPAKELYNRGCKIIISVFLSDKTIQNRADFNGASIIQIRPSTNIDLGIKTCFDFSYETVNRLIDQGYNDANKYIYEIMDVYSKLRELKTLGDEEDKQRMDLENLMNEEEDL